MTALPSLDVDAICRDLGGYNQSTKDSAQYKLAVWVATSKAAIKAAEAEAQAYEGVAVEQARTIARLQVEVMRLQERAALIGDEVL